VPPDQPSRSPLPALALIGAIAAAALLLFAWAAGLVGPKRVSGGSMIDALQYNAGQAFPGFRRAHTKGVCVTGHFDSNAMGRPYSEAPLFLPGRVPVMGRFSTNVGKPMSDDAKANTHALALRFLFPDGQEWRMAMSHWPIFPISRPEAFRQLQIASRPDPATGKPDPAIMKAYLARYPETQRFFDMIKSRPIPSSFANGTYHSISAFRFIAPGGETRAVRWQFEPETPFTALDPEARQPESFLFEDILARLNQGPLKWRMILVLANPGDRTDNATIEWTGPHRRIDVGELALDSGTTEEEGDCRGYSFDPTTLPRGVALSDDPLPAARAAAYSASFRRRAIEGAHPDPVSQQIEGDRK
jgi:catalase